MIKCVIIDDAQATIDIIAEHIKKVNYLQLVGAATNAGVGIELVKKHQAQLLFLDVDMSRITGLDVMWILQSNIKVIFCTAYSKSAWAVETHELNTIDYLIKPIPFNDFLKVVQKIKPGKTAARLPQVQHDYFYASVGLKGTKVRVNIKTIEFIESRSNYLAIYSTEHTIPVIMYGRLSDVENYLSPGSFIRVHKSFIVAVASVRTIEKNFIKLHPSQASIPLGRLYKEAFLQIINSKIIFPER